jgi:hypothetical protein
MSNTPPVLWFRVYEYDWIEKENDWFWDFIKVIVLESIKKRMGLRFPPLLYNQVSRKKKVVERERS